MTQDEKDDLVDSEYKIKLRDGTLVSGARLGGRLLEFPVLQWEDSKTGLGVKVEVSWLTAKKMKITGRALSI